MFFISGAAGAASFTHVHNVAAAHGQPGWLAWADAIVLELMSIASGLELRRRKRLHTPTRFPATVLGCAVTLSLAAQVAEAEPSPTGWIAAAVPALGFLVMVKVALGYTSPTTRTVHPPDPATPHDTADRSTMPAADRSSTTRTVHRDHRSGGPGRGPSTQDHALLPAARDARDHLAIEGRPLTRGALAEALRAAGHTVSNTRASALLKTLKAEKPPPPPRSGDPTP